MDSAFWLWVTGLSIFADLVFWGLSMWLPENKIFWKWATIIGLFFVMISLGGMVDSLLKRPAEIISQQPSSHQETNNSSGPQMGNGDQQASMSGSSGGQFANGSPACVQIQINHSTVNLPYGDTECTPKQFRDFLKQHKMAFENPQAVPASKEAINERGNLIADGNFEIPFLSRASAWGNGYHTDIYKLILMNSGLKWMNFKGADVQMSDAQTERGRALKISHKDETLVDRLGLTEQYIYVPESGDYIFSFWIKAENLEKLGDVGLLFATTDEWKREPEYGGYLLKKSGTFGWTPIKEKLTLEAGARTFVIASIAKGTVWITGLKLVKMDKNAL